MNALSTVTHSPGSEYILKSLPLKGLKTILDVGIGDGYASKHFLKKGLVVVGIGLNIKDYLKHISILKNKNFSFMDSTLESFDTKQKFDAVYMSQILEHTINPSIVLQKVRSLLNKNGWLFIMVPPYKSRIVGGHLFTGWNVGQLMYLLAVNGFDTKEGHYIALGHNICALVKKSEKKLPKLVFDKGDIENLKEFWPKNYFHGFEGDVAHINWDKLESRAPINIKTHERNHFILKKKKAIYSLLFK